MEPSPPKGRKPKNQRPFYDAGKRTSAEIIAEARSNVKTIETSRPFTPLEANRRLFGSATSRPKEGRPPSSLSIGSRSFVDSLCQPSSRPPTGKLTPIDSVSATNLEELINSKAAEAVTGTTVYKNDVEENRSGGKLEPLPSPPMSREPENSKTRKFRAGRIASPSHTEKTTRRVRSGPKERTDVTDERNVVIKRHSSVGDVTSELQDIDAENISSDSSTSVDSVESMEKSLTFIRDIVTPLLKQMELNHLHGDLKSLAVNFDMLWEMLKRGNMFHKPVSSGLARGRAQVLRTIFKFVDVEDPKILAKLSKLAILLNVTGKQQNSICKILYVVSKDQSQDTLFKEENLVGDILDIIGGAQLSTELDWLIYAVGSIKFLASSNLMHQELVDKNCLKSFGELLSTINTSLNGPATSQIQISHLLVQVSAAVRTLADIPGVRKQVLPSGIVEILLQLLDRFSQDPDYVLNISRILSKLTQASDGCYGISEIENGCKNLLELLRIHTKNQDIVVRLLFTFGNIAAKVDETKLDFYREKKSLRIIAATARNYMNIKEKISLSKAKSSSTKGEDMMARWEDVVIKATRFIANLSVHPSIGPHIADNKDIIDLLIDIIRNQSHKKNEELLINAAATLNNISFFSTEGSVFEERQILLCEALSDIILTNSLESTVEITRVFGNLTRSLEVRQRLMKWKFVDILVTMLDSNDREVVFCVCGALINMMQEKEARKVVLSQNGVAKLIDALKDFGQTDWQLAGMICQTFWNFSDSITSSTACFGEREVDDLIDILHVYLDAEIALDYGEYNQMDNVTKDLMLDIWKEQFVPVAQRLLERIRYFHTELVPLDG